MRNIVFIGSHLGYAMDRTPLGGGAMVGLQLARHWAGRKDFRLTVLGSGPVTPGPGIDYERVATPSLDRVPAEDGLVRMSEFGYARFCREFEAASAAALARRRPALPPEDTAVVLNDISESTDPGVVTRMGYPTVSVWHVDVVDYFNKMYFHNWVRPERVTAVFHGVERLGLGSAVPDVLRLVFGKQKRAVQFATRIVVPSKRMAETIVRCYGRLPHRGLAADGTSLGSRIEVLPWGGWAEPADEGEVDRRAQALRGDYRLGAHTRVVMTMSRLSPEKGILLLLEALRLLEEAPGAPPDVVLLICGLPAFMRGEAYAARVRRAGRRLRRYRAVFPGYLSAADKAAHFRLARLFVSPSIHESYGLSIVEALRAGLPVLASDHSGVDEILAPQFSRVVPYDGRAGGLLGTFARKGDIPRRLAAELGRLLADPAGLAAMGRAAAEAGRRMSFAAAADRLADSALSLRPAAGRA